MQSHERCSVVEVMGHRAGYLALYVGLAVGATAVLVPERPFDFERHVAEKIRRARLSGKTNYMIVVAEGAASGIAVGEQIQKELGLDPRVTILGHIQRGGSPSAKDRVTATRTVSYTHLRAVSVRPGSHRPRPRGNAGNCTPRGRRCPYTAGPAG